MISGERLHQVEESIVRNAMNLARCIVIVNRRTNSYECIKTDDFFSKIIPEQGSLNELYSTMFMGYKHDGGRDIGEYKQFQDLSVFEKEQYRANLHFIIDEKEYGYVLILSKMNEDEVSLVIKDQDGFFDSNLIEKEKADTIQESFLFSMIVNLADDSCINPNTTEVTADRQDFLDIKYSDWRIMISNMFKEEDRILFLRASSPENVINMLEGKTRFHIDLQMMNMQGRYAWSRLTFARMKNFSRENPRFLYTVDDISEDMNQLLRQEGITKAVEQQNEILQKADLEKTRFFANMSHEFRAPINAIIGMNEVILNNSRDEKVLEYSQDIKNAAKTLLHLVNDVLDFSKIQAGKMEIVPVEYDTHELVRNVSNMIHMMVQSKSLEYEVNIGDDVPKRLFGDEIRIAQIITNLLTNAVKYTDKGKVTLSIQTAKDARGMDAIQYSVRDTGRGIKKEEMDKIFSLYGRTDMERNRRVEGTGLGLGIVTGLLGAMNSSLQVESEYQKGSCFSFVLTQNYVDDAKEMEDNISEGEIDLSNLKILIVDDVDMNLKIANIHLSKFGGKADMVSGGAEALEMMKKTEYDIVFLDHLMPEMDGVETLNQARRISEYYKNAVFIALTGNASPTARDEYISLGFTDYMEKPIFPEKMKEILNHWGRKRRK